MDSTTEAIAEQASQSPDFWMMIVKSMGMLLIVLGVLFAITFIIKKISGAGSGIVKGEIKLLSLFHIAPKEKLVLIETNGKKVLLGVTPENINRLAVFKANPTQANDDMPAETPKGFASMLRHKLKPASMNKPATGDIQCTDTEQDRP